MIGATNAFGIVGAGWVHVVVAVVVVTPAYLFALHRAGVGIGSVLRECGWPTVSAIPAIAAAAVVGNLISDPLPALLLGGGSALAVYGVLCGPWILRRVRGLRSVAVPNGEAVHAVD